MRSVLLACLCGLSLLTLGACASSPPAEFADIEVLAEARPTFDLAGTRTYRWEAAAAGVNDPDREWTPPGLDIAAEIKFVADRELRANGRSQVVDKPDMLALFAVGVDMKAIDVTIDENTRIVGAKRSPKGGVAVVLVDPFTRRAIWIGRATANLKKAASADLAKRRIDYAVTKMFEDFPSVD